MYIHFPLYYVNDLTVLTILQKYHICVLDIKINQNTSFNHILNLASQYSSSLAIYSTCIHENYRFSVKESSINYVTL